jgi:hypothetical protein
LRVCWGHSRFRCRCRTSGETLSPGRRLPGPPRGRIPPRSRPRQTGGAGLLQRLPVQGRTQALTLDLVGDAQADAELAPPGWFWRRTPARRSALGDCRVAKGEAELRLPGGRSRAWIFRCRRMLGTPLRNETALHNPSPTAFGPKQMLAGCIAAPSLRQRLLRGRICVLGRFPEARANRCERAAEAQTKPGSALGIPLGISP